MISIPSLTQNFATSDLLILAIILRPRRVNFGGLVQKIALNQNLSSRSSPRFSRVYVK